MEEDVATDDLNLPAQPVLFSVLKIQRKDSSSPSLDLVAGRGENISKKRAALT